MERFVRRENVKHYRDLLQRTKSHAERQRIQVLLDEELRKQTDAGDDWEKSLDIGVPARPARTTHERE